MFYCLRSVTACVNVLTSYRTRYLCLYFSWKLEKADFIRMNYLGERLIDLRKFSNFPKQNSLINILHKKHNTNTGVYA